MKRQRIAARLEDMSPRERAHIGPRTLKDVNSEEYAWQTTAYLKTLYGFKEASLDRWIAALEEAEQHRIYDRIPPEKPYGGPRTPVGTVEWRGLYRAPDEWEEGQETFTQGL